MLRLAVLSLPAFDHHVPLVFAERPSQLGLRNRSCVFVELHRQCGLPACRSAVCGPTDCIQEMSITQTFDHQAHASCDHQTRAQQDETPVRAL